MTLCTSVSLSSLVSIIRGQVLTADGTPLIGVNVTFVHYPEHGYTVTRKDGMYVFLYVNDHTLNHDVLMQLCILALDIEVLVSPVKKRLCLIHADGKCFLVDSLQV